ncbi:hypothetical protein RvY_10855 [Ramazzottius varieornatus]|uniref:Uncharacterized protein n=1 Tax=Ramazzottius varieornatus TaxID=947166 RepID=A0A1D1VG70_RAMVA|nr:hypothetical protein RvY_10855 [Ramazzottius varieornatus]
MPRSECRVAGCITFRQAYDGVDGPMPAVFRCLTASRDEWPIVLPRRWQEEEESPKVIVVLNVISSNLG